MKNNIEEKKLILKKLWNKVDGVELRDDGNGLIFSCLICDKYLSPITVDGAKIFIEMLMESGQINFEKFSGLEKALEFFIRDKKDAYCHKTKQGNFCSKGCFDKFINSAQKLLDENLCDYDAYGLGIKEFFSNSKSYTNVKLTGHFDKNWVFELDLSNKGLERELNLSDFINLEKLDCSNNRLTKLILPKNFNSSNESFGKNCFLPDRNDEISEYYSNLKKIYSKLLIVCLTTKKKQREGMKKLIFQGLIKPGNGFHQWIREEINEKRSVLVKSEEFEKSTEEITNHMQMDSLNQNS